MFYDLSQYEVCEKWADTENHEQWYASQMIPTEEHTLINAEVMRTETGLYLYYSTIREPMRPSLQKGGQHVWGLQAHMILKGFLCANSWSWLNHLLDTYVNHVVELTALDIFFGVIPNYNSLFWECRRY